MVIESFESSKNLQQGFPAVKVYTSRWRRLALNKTGQYCCCWSQYCQILANTGQKEILLVTIQDNVGKYWLEKYCLQDTQQRFLFTLGEIYQHYWQSQFMTGMKRRMKKRRMMSVRLSDWQEALLKSAEHEMRSETELCGVYQKVVPNQPNQSKAYISRRGEWREVEEKILLICLRRGWGDSQQRPGVSVWRTRVCPPPPCPTHTRRVENKDWDAWDLSGSSASAPPFKCLEVESIPLQTETSFWTSKRVSKVTARVQRRRH